MLERTAARLSPMAVKTCEGSGCPVHADPVEMARPGSCSTSSSASVPGIVMLRFPGSRRVGVPLTTMSGSAYRSMESIWSRSPVMRIMASTITIHAQ